MSATVRHQPPVVLLHSSGSTAQQWELLAQALAPRFEVLPVELHGHGERSAWTSDTPFRIADDAALVLPLLERVGAAHLIGHSYGGAVALKLASHHRDLVRSVTAYEPVLFRWLLRDSVGIRQLRDLLAVAEGMRSHVARGDGASAAKSFVEYWTGVDGWRHMPPGRRNAIASRMPSVLRHFDALFSEPFDAELLSRSGLPMLFLTGSQTVDAPRRISELLRRAMPDASHETLEGMGHMGPITHAPKVNRRIEQFLHLYH
jgi:pimeloyl-ACP methyl ester carboxylesterase